MLMCGQICRAVSTCFIIEPQSGGIITKGQLASWGAGAEKLIVLHYLKALSHCLVEMNCCVSETVHPILCNFHDQWSDLLDLLI